MLTLITGSPGSGKTLWVVDFLKGVNNRTIYQDGVPELKLPWIPIDAHQWGTIPDGSILVVDEVQRIWGVRDPKKPVPADIQLFETHRHRGIDVFLMTQHPKMLDHHLRRLVGRHIHLRRNFGLPSSLLLEANEVMDDPQQPSPSVQRSQFVFPSSSFNLYKSAEIHTHKFRPTWKMAAVVLLLVASAWAIYSAFGVFSDWGDSPKPESDSPPATTPKAEEARAQAKPEAAAPASPPSYLSTLVPESPLVPESAPAYRDKIQHLQIPHLAGCIEFVSPDGKPGCNCYTQQGTRLETSYAECRSVIDWPPFQSWAPPAAPPAAPSDPDLVSKGLQPEVSPADTATR